MGKILIVLAFVVSCGGDDEAATPRETPCERLREHLIDLQLADAHVDREAHRVALRESLGRDFLASCSKLGDAEIACALDAPDSSAATACAPPTARN